MDYEKNVPSIGQWMLYILVAGIPLVGFIMLIVWAFDSANPVRKNWAAATLIWMVVGLLLALLFWGTMVAFIAGTMSH